jgi:hypothetical protein
VTLKTTSYFGCFAFKADDGYGRLLVFNQISGQALKLHELNEDKGDLLRIMIDPVSAKFFYVYAKSGQLFKARFRMIAPTQS